MKIYLVVDYEWTRRGGWLDFLFSPCKNASSFRFLVSMLGFQSNQSNRQEFKEFLERVYNTEHSVDWLLDSGAFTFQMDYVKKNKMIPVKKMQQL